METFVKIINACYENGFSDLHMTGDHQLVCRRDGEVIFQRQYALTPQYLEHLAGVLLNPLQLKRLREHWSVDLALTIDGKRMRLNVFSSHRGVSMAIRFLPSVIPDIGALNLHPCVKDFCNERCGLLLICGATGSGKTTTIAALINAINKARACHIVTLEDPIEYIFTSQKAFIEQRELGKHFHTYRDGLLDCLREAPDVIVVGEMRTPEIIQICLDAAESGHFVIATMHAGTHEEAMHRLCCGVSPGSDERLRLQLSSCLLGIVNQQLQYMPQLRFSVPVLSILRNSKAIATLIRDNKLSQLDGYMESFRGQGMFTFEAYRTDYLAKVAHFSPPPGRGAERGRCVEAPAEHASPLFDYSAMPEPGNGAGTAPKKGGRALESVLDAPPESEEDIDEYIFQLERRSD